jgi:hypothetical protein
MAYCNLRDKQCGLEIARPAPSAFGSDGARIADWYLLMRPNILHRDSQWLGNMKIPWTKENIAALRGHLEELISGTAFKGSRRSGEFLKYIVEETLAGHPDSLKERVIGVELFGRAPTYDTGEDAIVRVTAREVRRRLLQHYESVEGHSPFRISLPLGSYIPEISQSLLTEVPTIPLDVEPIFHVEPATVYPVPANDDASVRLRPKWLSIALLVTAAALVFGSVWWKHSSDTAPTSTIIWSTMFRAGRPVQLITSDPNIAEIQGLTGAEIAVSDYANGHYIPNPNALTPEGLRFCQWILIGDKSASVDTSIAASIGALAQASFTRIRVLAAREVHLSDLHTDTNFIFLGSPRSNPWTVLFNERLDFRMVYDKNSRQEFIRNLHPQHGELPSYVATAMGHGTGQSFATITFVRNPDQKGHVLILSGITAEGTQAAGELVTDVAHLSAALRHCGNSSSDNVDHLQILLRLSTMAGLPSNVDVVACHRLLVDKVR